MWLYRPGSPGNGSGYTHSPSQKPGVPVLTCEIQSLLEGPIVALSFFITQTNTCLWANSILWPIGWRSSVVLFLPQE